MTTSIIELQAMTDSEKLYRMNERLEEMYAMNADWKNVLARKWSMLVHTGGSL